MFEEEQDDTLLGDAPNESGRFGGAVQLVMASAGLAVLGNNGMRSILRGRAAAEESRRAIGGAALRELVRTRDLGFFVCTHCNTLGDRDWRNGCMRCGSVAEFLSVRDEDERKIAMAAVVVRE